MPSRCPWAFVLQAPAVGRAWDPMTSMTFLFHQHWPGLFPGWPWPTWQKSRLLLGTRASARRSEALHLESGDRQVAKDTQRRTGCAGTGIPSRDNQHLLFPQLQTFQGPSATGARELGPHRQHHSSGDTKRPGGPQVPARTTVLPHPSLSLSPSHLPPSAAENTWGHPTSTAGHPSSPRPCRADHGSSIYCGLLSQPPELFL